jgi:hypothetical protein
LAGEEQRGLFSLGDLSGVEFVGDGFVVDGESAVGITDDWD